MGFQQGLSGLNAAAKNLDAIGNNVANASTAGFKASQVQFADVYAASLSGGGAGQIGLGTKVANVTQQFTQGNISSTNNPLDVAVNGAGFFRLDNNGSISYTRNGQFQLDRDGFIVSANGYKVTGYGVDAASGSIVATNPAPVSLPSSDLPPQSTGGSPSASGAKIGINLDSREALPITSNFNVLDPTSYNKSTSMTVYDTLGNPHVLSLYFTKTTTAGTWGLNANVDGAGSDVPAAATTVAFNGNLIGTDLTTAAAAVTAAWPALSPQSVAAGTAAITAATATTTAATVAAGTPATSAQINAAVLAAQNAAISAAALSTAVGVSAPTLAVGTAGSAGINATAALVSTAWPAVSPEDTAAQLAITSAAAASAAVTALGTPPTLPQIAAASAAAATASADAVALNTLVAASLAAAVTATTDTLAMHTAAAATALTATAAQTAAAEAASANLAAIASSNAQSAVALVTTPGVKMSDASGVLLPQPQLAFDTSGNLTTTMPLDISLDLFGVATALGKTNGAVTPLTFKLDFSGTSQYGSAFGVNTLSQDGFSSGRLNGYNVGTDGVIQGRYSNGQSRSLGQIVLANFTNPNGLKPLGNNQWAETPDSNQPLIGTPGSGSLGVMQSASVEESNVDLTAELVNMITAQRIYQANAQSIKTQDAVLQTIVNLR